MTNSEAISQYPNHRKTVIMASAIAMSMLALGFASKPLYDTFCRVTGYGGTTSVAEAPSQTVLSREMTVRFDSNVQPNLDWTFKPEQRHITIPVGKNSLAFYTVKNNSTEPLVGTAKYNVMPTKAAPYFAKLQCFCFTEQRIEPGEEVRMPVLFFVDPQLDEKPRLDDVHTITLSYTFYKVEDPTEDALTSEDRDTIMDEVKALQELQLD